jgi:HAMP domain-containing protein
MPRFGLSTKIFLGTAAVVTAVLIVTLFATSKTSRDNADRVIQSGLTETNLRIAEQLQARQTTLAGRLGVFAQNRDVMATIRKDTSGVEARDQAQQAAEATHALWVQVFDTGRVVIAKSDDPGIERHVVNSPLVTGALEGHSMGAFGVAARTTLLQLVTVPLLSALDDSGSAVAVLMAALPINDSLAIAIGKATGSAVAFYVADTLGKAVSISGATMSDPEAKKALLTELTPLRLSDAAQARGNMMGPASERLEIHLGDSTYVGQGTPLYSANGRTAGGFVVLRNLDDALGGYYTIRRTLLIIGAGALIIAFLLSGFVARQIVRPVTALVAATRRAADGDYNAEIPATSGDEIGTLADAVRRLLTDLREKQALVEFLGGGSTSNPTLLPSSGEATQLLPGATARLDGNLTPGRTLGGRYDIKAMLGAGGMGMVYRAVDRELQEVVAIKTLKPEMLSSDSTALERFKSEIRLARKISHRNVVRTHDLGESQGLYFITMEFVEGTSLKDLVRQRGRLPVQVLLPIAKQLCRALEVAHDAGVIHRDIKPQNMVVERDGTLKVMDFGIARLATRAPSGGLTEAGMVVGTPEYMAPEQLLGDELDVRADIYSAAVVLYECLTGRLPFEAPSPIVLISRVLEETPATPQSLHSDIPVGISNLVMRAMSRDRDQRPPNAAALHDALEQIG